MSLSPSLGEGYRQNLGQTAQLEQLGELTRWGAQLELPAEPSRGERHASKGVNSGDIGRGANLAHDYRRGYVRIGGPAHIYSFRMSRAKT